MNKHEIREKIIDLALSEGGRFHIHGHVDSNGVPFVSIQHEISTPYNMCILLTKEYVGYQGQMTAGELLAWMEEHAL